MNPIARQALSSALGKLPRGPLPKPKVAKTFAEVINRMDLDQVDTSGPINKVMFLEGRSFALDVVRSAGNTITSAKLLDQVIQTLIRAAVGRPGSHALGIKSIIELLQVKS